MGQIGTLPYPVLQRPTHAHTAESTRTCSYYLHMKILVRFFSVIPPAQTYLEENKADTNRTHISIASGREQRTINRHTDIPGPRNVAERLSGGEQSGRLAPERSWRQSSGRPLSLL